MPWDPRKNVSLDQRICGAPVKPAMRNETELISSSIKKLEGWLKDHQENGFDPADGLTSYLRPLTFGNLLLSRVLQQLVWRSPVNLRPLLGIKPLRSFIGCGYIVRAQLLMSRLNGDDRYRQKAAAGLDWLMRNKAPGYEDYSWGKMFDFASRCGLQMKNEPITVWTSLIGQAFLDGYEIIGDPEYLKVAESICEWILRVPRTPTTSGACINYTPSGKGIGSIHNQSMLAGAMLARTAKYLKNGEYLRVAREAVTFTCTRQRSDGSWYYGEDPTYHWIDNFHTGYILDALRGYLDATEDRSFEETLNRGFSFYKHSFFDETGRPKYYHNRTFPIDSQCAAQAIDTLAVFSDRDGSALEMAARVAKWTIIHMQDTAG